MRTSESPLPLHRAGNTARRSHISAGKRCTQMLASALLLCLTLSACGGGGTSVDDSKLGSDNKTREVRCAR